jgi:hypothetical protein
MTVHARRVPFSLDPLIVEAKRRARQRRLLLAVFALVMAGGALGAAFAVRSSNGSGGAGATVASRQIANSALADCAEGVPGLGFQVFACMSGGARTGHPHPKELLVVRSDGSRVAYPAYRIGKPAVGDGEVVAAYNDSLVRVTSSRVVPLLTRGELAGALHIRRSPIDDIYAPTVDGQGNIYFHASIAIVGRSGCQNRVFERATSGVIHQVSASRNNTCR